MQISDDIKIWQNRWQAGQTAWDQGQAHPALESLFLHAGREGALPPAAKVFSAGCGRAHNEAALARKGLQVTAVDAVPEAIAAARALYGQLAGLTLKEADVFTLKELAAYDAVFDRAMLCALQPEHRLGYRDQIHSLLKPGGLFCGILFRQTSSPDGPPFAVDERTAWDLFGGYFSLCFAAPIETSLQGRVREEWICIWRKRQQEG